jgi:pimeloyl-ACP methyl ester carboxylesterase
MAYLEWGDPADPRVLLCVHGLTRSGRDFDYLARALAGRRRVVCPDVVGRGRSDHLRDPGLYGLPQYCADMVTLIARLDVAEVDWLGTSLGGLIGMALAAQPDGPIRRLVLNDVGPRIAAVALERIAGYLGQAPVFPTLAEGLAYLRRVGAPFGPLSDSRWRRLGVPLLRRAPGGGFTLAYDPGIAGPFRQALSGQDLTLWPLYDAVRCPTLVIRGAESDLLSRETVAEMAGRGPRARSVEVPGVGHAPTLTDPTQVALVSEFLDAA